MGRSKAAGRQAGQRQELGLGPDYWSWADREVDGPACKGMDPNLFYPERGQPIDPQVKQACDACPVIQECETHAITHGEPGVWGGTTGRERRAKRQQLGIPVRKPEAGHHQAALVERETRRRISGIPSQAQQP